MGIAVRRRRIGAQFASSAALTIVAALGPAATGALGAKPSTPTLTVRVSPRTVHPKEDYTITITGRNVKPAPHETAYLFAVIQYSAGACRPTIGAEHSLPGSDWENDFFTKHQDRGLSIRGTAFTREDFWTARMDYGTRHVCAYLYPSQVAPDSSAMPLAAASTTFRDVRGR